MNNNRNLEDLLSRYLSEKLLRPDTVKAYKQVAHRWIKDTEISDIRRIDSEAVLEWRNMVLERASPATWNSYRRHMSALLNFAAKKKLVKTNPFLEIAAASNVASQRKTVDLEVIQRALDYLASPECRFNPSWLWATVIRTFYYTGVRRRQLVGAVWGDMDFNRRIWCVRADTSKNHRMLILPIADPLLADLRKLHDATRDKLGRTPPLQQQVFCIPLFNGRYGGPKTTRSHVSVFFRRLSKELGTPISSHRIRHTVATTLAAQGNIRVVQDLLGHVSIQTTMRYIHPDLGQLRSLVESLPDI